MTREKFDNWLADPSRATLVMGVLNVTPDSFSDGNRFSDVDAAVAHAHEMCAQGADLIDIGGESTRPGSQRVSTAEQLRRVLPVFEKLAQRIPAVLSIDTTRSEVARATMDCGACLINDISGGLDDPAMFALAADRRVPIVLMHMQGQPATMQVAPKYSDVVAEIKQFLGERLAAAERAGIDRQNILLDPGIGFGKTTEHNLTLMRDLKVFAELSRPLVVGVSRKGFIGRITDEPDPANRLFGTAASVSWAVANGAGIVRVHDVGPMKKVVQMIRAIQFV